MSDKDEQLKNSTSGDAERISLHNSGKQPGDAQFMAYLAGELPPEDQHEIEQWLSEDGMESDALEGLSMLDAKEARHSVNKLNQNLRKTLGNKKSKRKQAKPEATSLIAIIVILLLAIVAFLVIKIVGKP